MIEETGVGIKNPIWFIGVVENRNDPRKEGRVQVRAFGVHGTNAQVPTEDLPWALCISGNYDPNYPIPPLNSWVFGFFIDGRDAQQPMILGLIPTQMTSPVDPVANGWGVIPNENVNLDSQGSRAVDFGQPQNSRKARGEEIQNTNVVLQEVNRWVANFSDLFNGLKIEEPAPAYDTQYPYNRVIETAGGHSIEMDDTPGGERITIFHNTGSFVEIDNSGVMNIKSVGDLYIGSARNIVVVSEGRQMVKVKGDAILSVDGSMTQEVNGDMRQVVHGNYELSVAGQLNLNGSEEIQARAGKLRLEANVEGINLKSGKNINIQSGQILNMKSGAGIFQEAVGDINLKGDNLFIQGAGSSNIKSDTVFIEAAGAGDFKAGHAKIGGGTKISLSASIVAADDIILLASGDSMAPAGAGDAITASPAEGTELPEPAEKSAGNGGGGDYGAGGYRNPSVSGGGGYVSSDDAFADGSLGTGPGSSTGSPTEELSSSYTQGALTPLLDLIGRAEGAGYDTIVGYVNRADYPSKPLTAMTVDEVLAWQDSIDPKYNSEASGRYQVMEDTLRGLKNSGVVSGNERFDPAGQDKIGIALLKIRGLNRFLDGTITAEQFGNNISYEWASLPIITGPRAGQGRYSGQGGRISVQEVLDVLKRVKDYKTNYNAGVSRPQ